MVPKLEDSGNPMEMRIGTLNNRGGGLKRSDWLLSDLNRYSHDYSRLKIGEGVANLHFLNKKFRPEDGALAYTRYIPIALKDPYINNKDVYGYNIAFSLAHGLCSLTGRPKEWDEIMKSNKPMPSEDALPYIKDGMFYPLKMEFESKVKFIQPKDRIIDLPFSLMTTSTLPQLEGKGYKRGEYSWTTDDGPVQGDNVWIKPGQEVTNCVGKDILLIYLDEDSFNPLCKPTNLIKKIGGVPEKYQHFIFPRHYD